MPKHEYGAVIDPEKGGGDNDLGKYFAIPGKGLRKLQYMTSGGQVRNRYKPATLLRAFNDKKVDKKVHGYKRQPFIIRQQSGTGLIVKRAGDKSYPLEVLYFMIKQLVYLPKWEFHKTVQTYVEQNFQAIYKRILEKEMLK